MGFYLIGDGTIGKLVMRMGWLYVSLSIGKWIKKRKRREKILRGRGVEKVLGLRNMFFI